MSTVFKCVVEMGRADDLCFERFTVVQRGLLKTCAAVPRSGVCRRLGEPVNPPDDTHIADMGTATGSGSRILLHGCVRGENSYSARDTHGLSFGAAQLRLCMKGALS